MSPNKLIHGIVLVILLGVGSGPATHADEVKKIQELVLPEALQRPPNGDGFQVRGAAFSPDGSLLAIGEYTGGINDYSGPQVLLWDVKAGNIVHRFYSEEDRRQSGQITSLSFSPDGQHLLTCGHDWVLRLWDVKTFKMRLALKGHRFYISEAIFSPDGNSLLSSEDECIILWDIRKGEETRRFQLPKTGSSNRVDLAFFPDGQTFVSGDNDGVHVWDVKSGKKLRHITHPSPVKGANAINQVAVVNDGLHILGYSRANHSELYVWDAKTGQLLRRFGKDLPVWNVAFSRGGDTIVSDKFLYPGEREAKNGRLVVWDAATGTERIRFPSTCASLDCLALSPDGRRLFAADVHSYRMLIWDLPSRK